MKRTALVGLLALVSWTAQAAQEVPGWRAGVAAAFFDFQADNNTNPPLGDKYIDDSSVGVKLYGQYRFNNWFAVEGAYHNSGDLESLSVNSDFPGELRISFDGFSLQGLVFIPLETEEIQPYLKAGMYDFDDELSVNGSTTSNSSENSFVFGGGAVIELSDAFSIRADAEWFDADAGDLWSVNLGLEFGFGRAKAAAVPIAAAAPIAAAEAAPPPAEPADSDGDGVPDDSDKCPGTPTGERVGPQGCTCSVSRQVEFAFDSAELTDADKAILDELAETLTRLNFIEGTVTGYTDSEGEEQYNLELSERRAQAVVGYLESKGIASSRMTAIGKGESDPIASNDTPEGRSENRRVVLSRADCNTPDE
jgi:outer membrane protein OmpA-like peptidoglycan-associated protein